ncbi:EF hand family protein [Musa troglodytarum]|uniref:EF hand family protein n=3 Tax=Musa troglodytarum TaxID=320322 RepID=A0A9E7F1M0_9LILI|nr:EF hand family protein [Musa troglodytarum]
MEKFISSAEPLEVLLLHTVLHWSAMLLERLSEGFMSFLHSYFQFCTCLSMAKDEQLMHRSSNQPREDQRLSRKEVEMVMDRLGICCPHEGEQLCEHMSSDEIYGLFEENEPSLEEVKAAFCFFDANNDGFIDAVELQTALLKLGITEGLESDACRTMISIYDENRDGKIGFNEFVKLMETSLS